MVLLQKAMDQGLIKLSTMLGRFAGSLIIWTDIWACHEVWVGICQAENGSAEHSRQGRLSHTAGIEQVWGSKGLHGWVLSTVSSGTEKES